MFVRNAAKVVAKSAVRLPYAYHRGAQLTAADVIELPETVLAIRSGRRHVSTTRGQQKFPFPNLGFVVTALWLIPCVQVYVSQHGLGSSGQVRSRRAAPAGDVRRKGQFERAAVARASAQAHPSREGGARLEAFSAGLGASGGARLQVSALGFQPSRRRVRPLVVDSEASAASSAIQVARRGAKAVRNWAWACQWAWAARFGPIIRCCQCDRQEPEY